MNAGLSIQKEKLELIQWLSTLEDKSIIEKIKEIRKKETKDWWNTVSEEEKIFIEKGLKDLKAGRKKPHSEVKKMYEKWL